MSDIYGNVKTLCEGEVSGEALVLTEPLSFWGGIDANTSEIIEKTHPQKGALLRGKIILLPGTKGSTAGPGALLELIQKGLGPKAIILTQQDMVCVLSSIMSLIINGVSLPVLSLLDNFPVETGQHIVIANGKIKVTNE